MKSLQKLMAWPALEKPFTFRSFRPDEKRLSVEQDKGSSMPGRWGLATVVFFKTTLHVTGHANVELLISKRAQDVHRI